MGDYQGGRSWQAQGGRSWQAQGGRPRYERYDDFDDAISMMRSQQDNVAELSKILRTPDQCRVAMTRESRKRRTLLMEAAKAGLPSCIKLLIQTYGACVSHKSAEFGDTALHHAAYAGKLEAVKMLLENGAKAGQRNGRRETAVHSARAGGSEECAKLLAETLEKEKVEKNIDMQKLIKELEGVVGWDETQKILQKCEIQQQDEADESDVPIVMVSPAGFWVGEGACEEHAFDARLCDELIRFFKNERDALQMSRKEFTVIDFGCGMGNYVQTMIGSGIDMEGYDGNPSTPALTKGHGKVQDLSVPFSLPGGRRKWVMSLEVGEHLPKKFESIFLDNVCNHADKGLILSWAKPGQGGFGHFNEQPDEYIRAEVCKRGFVVDARLEQTLRRSSSLKWFKDTIMAFRRDGQDEEAEGGNNSKRRKME